MIILQLIFFIVLIKEVNGSLRFKKRIYYQPRVEKDKVEWKK